MPKKKQAEKQSRKIVFIDHAMLVASAVHPLSAIPQVVSIYSTQSAEGVSLLTWAGFMVIGTIFLTYAIVHKLKPLIINQVIWFIIDAFVVVGILIF